MSTQTNTPAAASVKKTRQTKTPRQRAQEILDAAKARNERAEIARNKANDASKKAAAALAAAQAELTASEAAVKYAMEHPDLRPVPSSTATSLTVN